MHTKTDVLGVHGLVGVLPHVVTHECFRYAHQNGCPSGRLTCSTVAKNGHLECLKYAHENGLYWNRYTCSIAALNGHLRVFEIAHENGCPWNEYTCQFAAQMVTSSV